MQHRFTGSTRRGSQDCVFLNCLNQTPFVSCIFFFAIFAPHFCKPPPAPAELFNPSTNPHDPRIGQRVKSRYMVVQLALGHTSNTGVCCLNITHRGCRCTVGRKPPTTPTGGNNDRVTLSWPWLVFYGVFFYSLWHTFLTFLHGCAAFIWIGHTSHDTVKALNWKSGIKGMICDLSWLALKGIW